MLAPRSELGEALQALIESGKVVRLDDKAVISAEALAALERRVVDFLANCSPATVSEIRQALESSRRIVVPLLERLDRQGVTVRLGDRRALRG
jgi:selenocysteine-specific elongation factor